MKPVLEKAAFVTFYSCKGGVGRSMALVNVAGILAGRGFRVLALDMDLEAPGISYLMRQDAQNKKKAERTPGFVDLLEDACERGQEADLFALPPAKVVERYSYVYPVPEAIRPSDEGELRIMPAGRLDDGYQSRLDALSLGQLYREGRGQPLIAAFKEVVQQAGLFDFVFVDSRTGFSDEAGICTRDLADHLVVVMGLNRQNVDGTAAFLRSLKQAGIERSLRVVLSPVPTGEDELLEEREKAAAKALGEAWGTPLDLSIQIPYHPRLALTEEPHIFRRSKGYLFEAYARLEQEVLALAGLSSRAVQELVGSDTDRGEVAQAIQHLRLLRRLSGERMPETYHKLLELLVRPDWREQRLAYIQLFPASASLGRLAQRLLDSEDEDCLLAYERLALASPAWLPAYAIAAGALAPVDVAMKIYLRALTEIRRPDLLDSYATFLWLRAGDIANAERVFADIQVEWPHRTVSGFLNFIADVRGEVTRAIDLAKQTVKFGEPNNLARWLFRVGADAEARVYLHSDLHSPLNGYWRRKDLFYAFAHARESYPDALPELKRLLVRPRYRHTLPLDANAQVAIAAGHPEPEFLLALGRVIAGAAPLTDLDKFPIWSATVPAPELTPREDPDPFGPP